MSGLDLLLSQSTLLRMLVAAVALGLFLGAVYDVLCMLRMLAHDPAYPRCADLSDDSPTPCRVTVPVHILRFLLDLLFATITAIALILLCYYTNDGQLRAPAIFGMACGFFVYRRLCSPLVLRLAAVVMRVMSAVIGFCWQYTVGRLVGHMTAGYRRRATDRRLRTLQKAAESGFSILDMPPGE